MTILNLDRAAAIAGQAIVDSSRGTEDQAKALDRLTTRTMGVLQEHGLYATLLFLYTRTTASERPLAEALRRHLLRLLDDTIAPLPALRPGPDRPITDPQWSAVSAALTAPDGLLCRLDTLLLAHELAEQALLYTRYGAKAAAAAFGGSA